MHFRFCPQDGTLFLSVDRKGPGVCKVLFVHLRYFGKTFVCPKSLALVCKLKEIIIKYSGLFTHPSHNESLLTFYFD